VRVELLAGNAFVTFEKVSAGRDHNLPDWEQWKHDRDSSLQSVRASLARMPWLEADSCIFSSSRSQHCRRIPLMVIKIRP
jgi:hypothetical protein